MKQIKASLYEWASRGLLRRQLLMPAMHLGALLKGLFNVLPVLATGNH